MKPVGAMQDAMMQVALLKMLHCSKTLNQGMLGTARAMQMQKWKNRICTALSLLESREMQ